MLQFPLKVWYVYEGENVENDFDSIGWTKRVIDNDSLVLKFTPDGAKKKKIQIHICCAANFAKDLMLPEESYSCKVKVIAPVFVAVV